MAFFPTSLALAYLLAPVGGDWPVVLRVLVSTLLATPWMTYLFLPFVTRSCSLAARLTPAPVLTWLSGARATGGVSVRRDVSCGTVCGHEPSDGGGPA